MELSTSTLALSTAGVAYLLWRYAVRSRSRPSRPPGPKGYPLIGNVLDLPGSYEWIEYKRLSEQYGDLVYLDVFGQGILVLHSMEAINELLVRRGNKYSSRPTNQMVQMSGFEFGTTIAPYGERWRTHRRIQHAHLQPSVMSEYYPAQYWSTKLFLRDVLEQPEDLFPLTQALVGRSIMRMIYDIKTSGTKDPYIQLVEEAVRRVEDCFIPGKYLVEFIPQLRSLPDWLPGTGFKRSAAECKKMVEKSIDEPLETLEKKMAAGTNRPCMAASMLEAGPRNNAQYRQTVKDVAGISYYAGTDTGVAVLKAFYAAMLKYPAVQARAQAEVDEVIGSRRLPDFADRENLPYISALVSEVLRWIPAAPLALPHVTTEDDVYRGHFIPKGTMVLQNAWAVMHDPEIYPDPEEFRPERFLKEVDGRLEVDGDVLDPRVVVFGSGRRICPGRHAAEDSFWLAIASFLAVYSMEAPLDDQGEPCEVPVHVLPGFISHVAPLKCTIKPRSAEAEKLIREAGKEADLD